MYYTALSVWNPVPLLFFMNSILDASSEPSAFIVLLPSPSAWHYPLPVLNMFLKLEWPESVLRVRSIPLLRCGYRVLPILCHRHLWHLLSLPPFSFRPLLSLTQMTWIPAPTPNRQSFTPCPSHFPKCKYDSGISLLQVLPWLPMAYKRRKSEPLGTEPLWCDYGAALLA